MFGLELQGRQAADARRFFGSGDGGGEIHGLPVADEGLLDIKPITALHPQPGKVDRLALRFQFHRAARPTTPPPARMCD